MAGEREIAGFIRDTFGSVWTLELLLFLRQRRDRALSPAELVEGLRASDAIVANGVAALVAAGLIIQDADGGTRYQPVSAELDALAEGAQRLYAQRASAVRRLIVGTAEDGLTAFADAFRLRRD